MHIVNKTTSIVKRPSDSNNYNFFFPRHENNYHCAKMSGPSLLRIFATFRTHRGKQQMSLGVSVRLVLHNARFNSQFTTTAVRIQHRLSAPGIVSLLCSCVVRCIKRLMRSEIARLGLTDSRNTHPYVPQTPETSTTTILVTIRSSSFLLATFLGN